jgi:hypothetical protein
VNTPAQQSQIARINRMLAKKDWGYEKVFTSRGQRSIDAHGLHYLLDTYTNTVCRTSLDLDWLEQKLIEEAKAEAKRKALIELGVKIKYREFIDKYSNMTPEELALA